MLATVRLTLAMILTAGIFAWLVWGRIRRD